MKNLLEICAEETKFMEYQLEGKIWTQNDEAGFGKLIIGDNCNLYAHEVLKNEYVLNPKNNVFVPVFWV